MPNEIRIYDDNSVSMPSFHTMTVTQDNLIWKYIYYNNTGKNVMSWFEAKNIQHAIRIAIAINTQIP